MLVSEISEQGLTPDTRRGYVRFKEKIGEASAFLLFCFALFILLEPFLKLPLLFVPEILFLVGLWLVNAAIGKVKIPKNFRHPPDYPKKRPLWFPRKRYRVEKSRGMGEIYVGFDLDRKTQLWQSGKDHLTHTLGLGSTGSGKTVTLLGKLFCYLCNGSGALFNDAKGTNELYFQVLSMLRRMGCVESLVLVNFLVGKQQDPLDQTVDLKRVSNSLDLVSNSTPEMLRTIFMGLLRQTSGQGDMWRAKVGTLLYGIFVALKDKESKNIIVLDLAFIREFIASEAYCFLYFDTRISEKAKRLVRGYLNEAPNFSLDLAKYYIHKKCVDLLQEDNYQTDVESLLWERYRVKLNPVGLATIQNLIEDPFDQELLEAPLSLSVFTEQWGYLSMQLSESFQVLLFEFEHIFNPKFIATKEIEIANVALDRLVCLQFMPTLERDEDSFAMMAKIMMGSLRPLFAEGISANVRGSKQTLLDGMPTNARFPFAIDLDEYPQYGGKAPGMGAAAALVRSMGFALSFCAQQLSSLIKENEKEFANVYGNTANLFVGKIKDEKTIESVIKAAGKGYVARLDGFKEHKHKIGRYQRSKELKIKHDDRLKARQLTDLAAGQGYFIRGDTLCRVAFFGILLGGENDIKISNNSQLNYFVRTAPLSEQALDNYRQKLVKVDEVKVDLSNRKLPKTRQTTTEDQADKTLSAQEIFSQFAKSSSSSDECK
ncbi:MAG: TraM recognition domain-containing protein [Enterobacterales bacterium]|nr:TraM recognition domain-containing protein [Enterobacterales bacterium]